MNYFASPRLTFSLPTLIYISAPHLLDCCVHVTLVLLGVTIYFFLLPPTHTHTNTKMQKCNYVL